MEFVSSEVIRWWGGAAPRAFCRVSGSTSQDALLVMLDNECGVRNDCVLSGNVVV